jgi:hypothetical protein
MSKFRVGQRVRFVRATTKAGIPLVGKTMTIAMHASALQGAANSRDWALDSGDGGLGVVYEWQIAPAYDGNEKVSWSEFAWQPTPERVA